MTAPLTPSVRSAGIAVVSLVALLTSVAPATASPSEPLTPTEAAAQSTAGASLRDRVLPPRPRGLARAAASVDARDRNGRVRGGLYTGRSGITSASLRVYVSNQFPTWDRTTNQLWADRFAAMLHGREIAKLRVYLAPLSQIRSPYVCGKWADSCYDPNEGIIYLTGERPEDGADINQIATHEYAHHIAANRSNLPWDTLNWGPKYWATAQRVCSNTAKRMMWPNDPFNHYEDHPGEIWAETYRLVSSEGQGITPDPWEIIAPRWDPTGNESIFAAARRDVLEPWPGQRATTATGTLGPKGSQWASVPIALRADGRVSAQLTSRGSLRATVAVVSQGDVAPTPIGTVSRTSSTATACGRTAVWVMVTRTGGSGSWSLKVSSP